MIQNGRAELRHKAVLHHFRSIRDALYGGGTSESGSISTGILTGTLTLQGDLLTAENLGFSNPREILSYTDRGTIDGKLNDILKAAHTGL